jgi:hypothetical protein
MHAIAGNGEVCEKSVTARALHCLLLQLNRNHPVSVEPCYFCDWQTLPRSRSPPVQNTFAPRGEVNERDGSNEEVITEAGSLLNQIA